MTALLLPFDGVMPRIADSAFLAPGSVVVGNVEIGAEASIWFGAVLRGDDPDHAVVVGARSSVQENCVIHVGRWGPTSIGKNVTVGHGATMESCTIGAGSLVGMNSVILPGAVIGASSVVAAGAVVTEGMEVPDSSVVAGVPARVRKVLEGSAADWVQRSADHYVSLSRRYLAQGVGRVDGPACDLCGAPMIDRHCKLTCPRCGYQRDCSDP